jgi:membrane protein
MKPHKFWNSAKAIFWQWLDNEPFQMAAALAYYTIFSLAPLLLIAIAIAGFAFGREAAQDQVVEALQDLVGRDSARAIQQMIRNAGTRDSGFLAAVFGILLLLFGAGGVVGQLQYSLNKIWRVAGSSQSTVMQLIRQRLLSFAVILAVGFLLLVSLVVTAVLSAVSQFFSGILPGGEVLWQWVDVVVSFGFITLLFALIYKILPDVYVPWNDVWIGAAMTSFLFTLGKLGIGMYLGRSSVSSTYGAAGSLVTLLLWVYYSSLIFFLGAELTRYYSAQRGQRRREAAIERKRWRRLSQPQ